MGESKMPFNREDILKEYEDGTHEEVAKERTVEFQKEKSGVQKLAGEKIENSFEDYQLAKSLGFEDDAKKNLGAMADSYRDATQELENSAKWGPVLKFLMENKKQPLDRDSFKRAGLEINVADLWNFLQAKYGESVSFAQMNLPGEGGIMRIGETDFFFSLTNGFVKIFKPAPDSPMVTNYNSYKNGEVK